MAFKRYDKRTHSRFPTVSLSNSGHLTMNSACARKYLMGTKTIDLFYDEEFNIVGIKPYKKEVQDAFKVTVHEGKSVGITCKGFLKHFGIELPSLLRFVPAWNEEEELIEIHLGKPISQENIEKAALAERKAESKNRSKGKDKDSDEEGIEI